MRRNIVASYRVVGLTTLQRVCGIWCVGSVMLQVGGGEAGEGRGVKNLKKMMTSFMNGLRLFLTKFHVTFFFIREQNFMPNFMFYYTNVYF